MENGKGKKYYCDILSLFLKDYKLDEMSINLLQFIIQEVKKYEGEDDILLKVPVSKILNVEKFPKKKWDGIIANVVDGFKEPITFESNLPGRENESIPIIQYDQYKVGEEYFEINIPLSRYIARQNLWNQIPDYRLIEQ